MLLRPVIDARLLEDDVEKRSNEDEWHDNKPNEPTNSTRHVYKKSYCSLNIIKS